MHKVTIGESQLYSIKIATAGQVIFFQKKEKNLKKTGKSAPNPIKRPIMMLRPAITIS
jgi:hypothetical protein